MITPFINGGPIEVDESRLTPVISPADGRACGRVLMGGSEDMIHAIGAAHAVRELWGNTVAAERELVLIRAADVLERKRQEVVDLLIDEAGSTFGKAQFELTFTVSMLRSAAGEARRIFGSVIPSDVPGLMSFAVRKPLGVVAGIAPFNFPLILATKKVCMALAAGNTMVLKPSEEASLVGLKIAEVFNDAGLPPGVLNVVPGDGPMLGGVLVNDPRVRLISFTGSTAVGRSLAVECAKQGKRIVLEMGGKSPLIVLKDADIGYAIDTACFSVFIHQGQICMAGSRVIVESPSYESFVAGFAERVSKLKTGDPHAPDTIIGPLIRASQCQFISRRIEAARAAGARVVCGGNYSGNYFEPTVLADVRPDMAPFREELFGPVVCVTRAADADEALRLANDSSYGLSSAVITNDLQLAMKFVNGLEAGMVHVNGPTVHDEPHVPFGGTKDSGMGREGGHWSMEEMTELKWVTIQLGKRRYPF